MSDMNDKELLEQLNIIKADAQSVEISENISFENMKKRYEIKEKERTDSKVHSDNRASVKERFLDNWKCNKGFRVGIAALFTAAMLVIILGITGKDYKLQAADEYYRMVKADTASDTEVATLSGYEELHKYFIVEHTKETKYSLFEHVANFFDSISLNLGEDKSSDGSSTEAMSGNDYSQTNTRTAGIDEADVAKTDGEYIYYLHQKSGEHEAITLNIAKADGAETVVAATIQLSDLLSGIEKTTEKYVEEIQMEMMLYEDKLVVVADYMEKTVIMFFDITDKEAPKNIDTLYVEGDYQSGKLDGDYLYVFSRKNLSSDMSKYIEENKDALNEEAAEKLLAVKSSNGIVESTDVYVSECEEYCDYEVIATVDMRDTSAFKQVKAILGSSTFCNIYMSTEHIYYLSDVYVDLEELIPVDTADENKEITVINKTEIISLSYGNGIVEPECRTIIDGSVGDEFDVDEYNGYLRMAVNLASYTYEYEQREREFFNGFDWCEEVFWNEDEYVDTVRNGSALYVLDANLNIVGSIPELKEDESVYGVRFVGDIGYIVTYRLTDPLFTIDLSNPTNPTVLDEFKIPGFSEYLHKWDENTLVGLGYRDDGRLKIVTFDITDKTNVTKRDTCFVEAYTSQALYDHRALLISPEKNLIGFECDCGYCYNVYSYIDGKLKEVISHKFEYSEDMNNGYANIRGLYIGEYLYIISESQGMFIYDLHTYDKVETSFAK